MPRLIEGVEYSQRAHYDCTEQALEVALRFFGYELEDILFDEWRFVYVKMTDTPGFWVGPGPSIDREQKFRDWGISLEFKRTDSVDDAWAAITGLIDQNKPVPVWVDPYFFGYYSPTKPRHTDHAVVVDGYDEAQDAVHIVDPSPWQLFKGYIPLNDFKEALNSAYHQEQKETNSWIEFGFSPCPVGRDPARVKARIEKNIEVMLPGEEKKAAFEGGHKGIVREGMRGIKAFAEDVGTWKTWEKEALAVCMKECRDPLQQVARRLYGHGCFLHSAGEVLGRSALQEISRDVGKLSDAWFLPANMFFKGSLKDPLAMLPRIQKRLWEIADRQEKVLMALREVIGPRYGIPK